MNASKQSTVVIATRESRLALWQAEHVKSRLETELALSVSLLGMTTRGDQILDRSLSKVGGKGLFVKELETALEEGRARLAVHSLKDVPMELPDGFELAAILEREDPRDALVSNRYATLAELPLGALVGTSSLRRVVQLKALRPDLRIEPLRGNLDTRMRKLDDGGYDAIVLAAAGLKRLGAGERIRACFTVDEMIPCAGQGALGLEVRADDLELKRLIQSLTHRPTWLATLAERAVSRALGGSCSVPLAAHGRWVDGALLMTTALGHAEQTERPLLRTLHQEPVQTEAQAEALGQRAAQALREQGAADYLPQAC
ncbi:hydroxymethylbilane synthase [Roseateles koreensis]|uniref:Porphobilinogen deaminase n=1 Tax=Roseateles koreensis TaxID=2987526 RepID=A0ABT5KNB5_9BURK|nr:hydroxymethylbilane synthase [Roseateles koreensis]MDC8784374.1 hydroxymethylbilane synthase [Roseateles koreensis]